MRLTEAQRAQFDRDGSLFFPGLFTPAWIPDQVRDDTSVHHDQQP